MRFLQINANRSQTVHSLADQLISQLDVSVVLISEPNIRQIRTPGWLVDNLEDVAIGLRGVQMTKWGFVWAEVDGCTIFTRYISPNITMEEYEQQLEKLRDSVRASGRSLVITSDFNTKAFM
jgi:hypothetical protein